MSRRFNARREAGEEAIHRGPRDAFDEPLTDTRDGAADVGIGVDVHGCTRLGRLQSHLRIAVDESRTPSAFYDEPIRVRWCLVLDGDFSRVAASDRGHGDDELRFVTVVAERLQLATPWQTSRDRLGVHQQIPHLVARGVERIRAADVHETQAP